MIKRIVMLVLVPLLLAACTAVSEEESAANQATGPTVVVYRAPS